METKGLYKAILYSRVSTTNDDQAESIDNQILLAKNYLDKHPNIELAEPLDKYSEKISGKTDIRPKFQEMCQRLSRGDIHYLMIKDLKRLSRSVETTYAFLNLMKQYGFEIIQLSSGNVIDSSAFEEVESNLLIGVEALFAQNMVLTQSRYGRTVQRVRCENKILAYKDSTLFGYKWNPERRDIVIDEEKAPIIRELFSRYVFQDQGIMELREYLSSIGHPYSHVTVSKWLQEGKYIGDWTINRKGSVLGIGQGAKTHRFNIDRSEWIHIERPDLAIVDKEIFEMAQRIRLSRVQCYSAKNGDKKIIGRFMGTHMFSNKVYCAECGSRYTFKWADQNRTIPAYKDNYRQSKRDLSKKCSNIHFRSVTERQLKEFVVTAINAVNLQGAVSVDMMTSVISTALHSKNETEEKKRQEEQALKSLEKEAERISDAFIDATSAMRSRLNKQLEDVEREMEACKRRIKRLDNQSADAEELRDRLEKIKSRLSGWLDITEGRLDRGMIEKMVSKIELKKDGSAEVSLVLENLQSLKVSEKVSEENEEASMDIEMPPEEVISANVRKVYQEIEREEPARAQLDMMSVSQTGGEKKDRVIVKIDTVNCDYGSREVQ